MNSVKQLLPYCCSWNRCIYNSYMRIEDAIKQKRFDNVFLKLNINMLFTTSWLLSHIKQALDPFQISWQQFNILRILRGAQSNPLSLKLISDRMIDKTSNTSRLIDKLVAKGMVDRIMCSEDRRKVDIFITDKGLNVVNQASINVEEKMRNLYEPITENEAIQMNDLLDKLRN